jgi:hypothetical protein
VQIKNTVQADPNQWSEKSKQSYYYHYIKEYKDIEYTCWHCRKETIYTAKDQKYTFEVKKAYIDQQRILCNDCWKESLKIASEIQECEKIWADSKDKLKTDSIFLSKWLKILELREKYVPYKANTAAKNMLKGLLNKNA